MLRILIADKVSPRTVSALKALGAEVTMNAELSAKDLPGAIGDANVLIVRSTEVTADTLKAGQSLEVVIRAGAGVNTIDLDQASRLGIAVANCPGKNTDAVAELALGLLIAADRRIVDASLDLRQGRWRKKEYGKAAGLKDRTLGLVGLGSIGQAMIKRAQGLEMNVVGWSRSLTPERAEALGIGYCKTLEDLAVISDAVSVHLAKTAETSKLLGAAFFGKMKNGAIFVNTARGEVVDAAALKDAIASKKLRVGLDVFAKEPEGGDCAFEQAELAALVSGTPHIGASTDQASEAIADEVVFIVKSLVETGKPLHTVNIRGPASSDITLLVRHYNRVGVLASVLDLLREENINVEEMENIIFNGNAAAMACLKLDHSPSAAVLSAIAAYDAVIQVSVK